MKIVLNRRIVSSSLAVGLLIASSDTVVAGENQRAEAGEASNAQAGVITVRPPSKIMSRQGLPQFVGISEDTVDAEGLSMNLVIIPPGGAAQPHMHRGFESAVYLLEGRVETRYGPGLKKSVVNQAGDFIFIPPNVPHQPRNLSDTKAARAIVARNDPDEQENVVRYHPATDE
jgi:uncharacterized RmlC-like cupin family protein